MLERSAGRIRHIVMYVRVSVLRRPTVVGPVDLLHGLPIRTKLACLHVAATTALVPPDLGVGVHRRRCEFSVRTAR